MRLQMEKSVYTFTKVLRFFKTYRGSIIQKRIYGSEY